MVTWKMRIQNPAERRMAWELAETGYRVLIHRGVAAWQGQIERRR